MRSFPTHAIASAVLGYLLLATTAELLAAPPKVNYLFPAGGQQGQTVKVALSGDLSAWPVQVWSDHPGVSATAESDKGNVLVKVEPDARPGIAWLRFHTSEGASGLQPFLVGSLEEIEEKEPNDAPSNPQPVGSRSVVNGRLQKNGDLDGFKVSLKQGETLVAAVQANSLLGSPVDSVLQIAQLVERRSLADAPSVIEAFTLQQDHDSVGLDPRLVFTAPRDGDYLLRIFGFPSEPNSTIAFAGGDSFIYRLTLTTGPYLAGALPMAVSPGDAAEIQLVGWNLPPDGLRATVAPLPDSSSSSSQLATLPTTISHPETTGFIQLAPVSHAIVTAPSESNPQEPLPLAIPAVVSGQLAQPGTIHSFEFDAAKGQKLRLNLEASSLGFPWDPHLAVADNTGKVLTESDDAKKERDPQIVFTAPADGKFRVLVRDLNRHGGLDFIYRLTIEPATPDYLLTLAADNFVLAADKQAEIPVAIDRRDGFAEPVTIQAVGLPEGVTAEVVVSEAKGDSSKSVKLVLKATGDLSASPSRPIFIEGKTADGGMARVATFSIGKPLASDGSSAWLSISK